jgi:hypothetical protein
VPSGEDMKADIIDIGHWLLDLIAAVARKVGRWP